jgi:acyl carrier protein
VSSKKNVEAIYPLSRQQEGMLLETLAARQPGIHIEQLVCALAGELDASAFEQAWQRVVARHSVFRTAFAWQGRDHPLQVVLERTRLPVAQRDLRHLAPAEREAAVAAQLAADLAQGFEMSRAPLMRVMLLRTAEQEHQMIWTHHHILLDGWCRPIVMSELITLYQALVRGEEPRLAVARPYRDYISWLAAKQGELPQAETYWRRSLAGFTRPTPLGVAARAAPFDPNAHHGTVDVRLPAAATAALRAQARRSALTLSTLLQGVWALLLSRYSGERDVVFGTTVSGRPAELDGVESMVGLFISTLPFRVRIRPEAPVWEWLRDLQARHLDLRSYEYCSAGQIQQWSEIPGATPLYDSILVFENYPSDQAVAAAAEVGVALELDSARAIGAITRHPLTILSIETEDLAISLIYDSRRLSREDVERVARHFATLLDGLATAPEATVEHLLERIPGPEAPLFRALFPEVDERPPYVAPRTPTELALATLWQEVLGVSPVGAEDSFLALGGHSLLATQLLARIKDSFGVELQLLRLYESPSLGHLAAAVVQAQAERVDAEVIARLLDEIELLPAERVTAGLPGPSKVREATDE